jgi:hypothetical protein
VFEKRVLRRIIGPKRDEVTGEWRKLLIAELNDLTIEKCEMGRACSVYRGQDRRIQGFRGET